MNLKFALIFVLSELVCWGLGGTRLVAEDRLPVKDKPVNVLVLMTDDFSRHCVTATGGTTVADASHRCFGKTRHCHEQYGSSGWVQRRDLYL